MYDMQFSQLVEPLQAQHKGPDATFRHVSIDTRTINPDELFIAISGPNFDGHDFIEQAAAKGAVGVLVEREVAADLPQLIVADAIEALAALAKLRRQSVTSPILSVTGSCGKTTTKSMMASILTHCGTVHAGKKSHNNHYGVPLTILGIAPEHDYVVVEMGANHHNEIKALTEITQPTTAAITLAAPVHIEGFGDLDGVSRAKGEIFLGLVADGTAIINLDDAYHDYWLGLVKDYKVVTFGLQEQADIRATDIRVDELGQVIFNLHTPIGECEIALPLLGEHNVVNALAAAASTYAVGAALDAIKKGLEMVTAVANRLIKRVGQHGVEIIDDSYNANPVGVEAALKVLARSSGHKIFVLGEMGELGDHAEEYHRDLAKQALDYGVEQLYALGDLALHTVKAFGQGAHHFEQQEQLIAKLKQDLQQQATQAEHINVLVKGSRITQMDKVVDALIKDV